MLSSKLRAANSNLRSGRQVAKVQIDTGTLEPRTYTPISIDNAKGSLSFLCFLRPGQRGTKYLESLKVGAACEVMGPRGSIDFAANQGEAILFGDETSIGASRNLEEHLKSKVFAIFEAANADEFKTVFTKLGLTVGQTVTRKADDSHLKEIADIILKKIGEKKVDIIYLTGRASSSQALRKHLKQSSATLPKIVLRAYWADGKVGLD